MAFWSTIAKPTRPRSKESLNDRRCPRNAVALGTATDRWCRVPGMGFSPSTNVRVARCCPSGVTLRRADAEEIPDETLMSRYQSGDASAFAVLMRRHIGGIYNFIARHTPGGPNAEDLTQEVFLRVVERASTFKHEARFATWIYAIARNLCVDTLRKMSHRNHPSLDETNEHGGSLGDQVGDDHPRASGERMAQASEMRERLTAALERLPEEQREVFLLREVANLPFQEIAAVTGTPENTVKSRMRYALERLQESLEDYEEAARALR
jgi:RNA polymerase sigma-70 factor (ECF subfamily)